MFLCKKCHPHMALCPHMFTSLGACESCGKVRECYDCKVGSGQRRSRPIRPKSRRKK